MAKICSVCGGTQFDSSNDGSTVCVQCGNVVDGSNIVSEVQFSDTSQMIGTYVNERGQVGRSYRNMGRDSRELSLENARRRIHSIADSVNLKQHHIDMALRMYSVALEHQFTKGRTTPLVSAACLYVVCRREGSPHLLIDFSEAIRINVFALANTFLALSALLNLQLPLVDPSLFIQRFAKSLEFEDKTQDVINTANKLIARMKRDWMHLGRKPSGVCGASLFLAARIHGFQRTKQDIIQAVKISDNTLSLRLKEFKNTPAASLTISEVDFLDFEQEQDPPAFKKGLKREKKKEIQSAMLDLEDNVLRLKYSSIEDLENNHNTVNPSDIRKEFNKRKKQFEKTGKVKVVRKQIALEQDEDDESVKEEMDEEEEDEQDNLSDQEEVDSDDSRKKGKKQKKPTKRVKREHKQINTEEKEQEEGEDIEKTKTTDEDQERKENQDENEDVEKKVAEEKTEEDSENKDKEEKSKKKKKKKASTKKTPTKKAPAATKKQRDQDIIISSEIDSILLGENVNNINLKNIDTIPTTLNTSIIASQNRGKEEYDMSSQLPSIQDHFVYPANSSLVDPSVFEPTATLDDLDDEDIDQYLENSDEVKISKENIWNEINKEWILKNEERVREENEARALGKTIKRKTKKKTPQTTQEALEEALKKKVKKERILRIISNIIQPEELQNEENPSSTTTTTQSRVQQRDEEEEEEEEEDEQPQGGSLLSQMNINYDNYDYED